MKVIFVLVLFIGGYANNTPIRVGGYTTLSECIKQGNTNGVGYSNMYTGRYKCIPVNYP